MRRQDKRKPSLHRAPKYGYPTESSAEDTCNKKKRQKLCTHLTKNQQIQLRISKFLISKNVARSRILFRGDAWRQITLFSFPDELPQKPRDAQQYVVRRPCR